MNFIKKIFDGDIDNSVHLQFQKFSKGEFKGRAMIKASKTKDKFNIATTAEFANELVRDMAKKLGNEKTKVTGAIISTLDLSEEIEFEKKKQFQGIKTYVMNKEMSGDEIIRLIEKFPKVFFGLSFSTNDSEIKVKPKPPKSGKPGSKTEDKGPKIDFCRIKTPDKEIGESFVFEKSDFKKAEITHDFVIESIVVPDELKNEKDFAKIREMSKRKGRILRHAVIDGENFEKEIEFEA